MGRNSLEYTLWGSKVLEVEISIEISLPSCESFNHSIGFLTFYTHSLRLNQALIRNKNELTKLGACEKYCVCFFSCRNFERANTGSIWKSQCMEFYSVWKTKRTIFEACYVRRLNPDCAAYWDINFISVRIFLDHDFFVHKFRPLRLPNMW